MDRVSNRQAFVKGLNLATRVLGAAAGELATVNDQILIGATVGAQALTLPSAADYFDASTGTSKPLIVVNGDTDDLTVTPDGSETINGSATLVLDVQYEWCILISNGTNWLALV